MNDNMKIKYFDEELEVYDERRVVNKNTYSITLNYVPSPTRPLTVENGKTMLTETTDTPNANQYVLDRENGLLLFNKAMKGKVMTINYSAIGLWCISADKVYTNVDNKGEIIETLEDLMRENRQAIESIKTVGDASTVITQLQANIDSVTGLVGNIAEGSSVNEELTKSITSGKGTNTTLTNTISNANNKINEMNTWVNQHGDIVNLDNRVDTVEVEIPKINEQLDNIIQQQDTIIICADNITTDVINNALEQAQQKRIYNVFLPNREEVYLIDKEIMIKSNIRFYSNGATLKPTGNILTVDACPIIRNYNFGASAYNGDYNITIEGFNIDCNNSKVSGVGLAHTNNCKIKNNKIINTLAPSHGMDLVCNKDLIVENNYLQNCPQGGIQIDGSLEGSLPTLTEPNLFVDNIGSKNVNVINNRFYNCRSGAVHFHKTRHENITVDSNIFEQCDGCIVDDNNYNSSHQNVTIKNNSFIDNNTMSCIVFYAGHNKLYISNNKFINVKNAIILDKNLSNNNKYNDLVIINNIFDTVNKSNINITNGNRCIINSNILKEYGTTDTTEYCGINLIDSNYVTISDNNIYNVVGEKIDRIAIKNNEGCTNIKLINNNIVGCKNAWLGGVNTQYVEITNNTIRNCDLQALKCESFSTVLKNVIIQNNIIDTTGDNAIRFANIQGCIINGNIIRNYPNDKRGISLNTCTYSNISNNHITGLNYGISVSCENTSVTTGLNNIGGNVLNGNTVELLNGTKDNIVTNNIIKGKTLSLDESNNTVTNNRIVS